MLLSKYGPEYNYQVQWCPLSMRLIKNTSDLFVHIYIWWKMKWGKCFAVKNSAQENHLNTARNVYNHNWYGNEFEKCNLIRWNLKQKHNHILNAVSHIHYSIYSIYGFGFFFIVLGIEFYEVICLVNIQRWCHSHSCKFIYYFQRTFVEMKPIFSIDFPIFFFWKKKETLKMFINKKMKTNTLSLLNKLFYSFSLNACEQLTMLTAYLPSEC